MIKANPLFNTPDNWDDLIEWINSHDKESRNHLITASAMAWNLAVKTIKENEDATNPTTL